MSKGKLLTEYQVERAMELADEWANPAFPEAPPKGEEEALRAFLESLTHGAEQ